MQRDGVGFTFLVAGVLCGVCSLLVALTAEGLKDRIENNQTLDRQKNVLIAAGLATKATSAGEVSEIFESNIEELSVDLASGDVLSEGETPAGYDAEKAAKDPEVQVAIEPAKALMGVRYRAPIQSVYKIKEDGATTGFIFPVEGKGLWSTLKGFIALEADGQTVRGITFYSHKETPGLGGEVDNEGWKAKWKGKQVYDDAGQVGLGVIKGVATTDYQIDGLSGATITSNGVDGIVEYWLGDNGYGPFIDKQTKGEG